MTFSPHGIRCNRIGPGTIGIPISVGITESMRVVAAHLVAAPAVRHVVDGVEPPLRHPRTGRRHLGGHALQLSRWVKQRGSMSCGQVARQIADIALAGLLQPKSGASTAAPATHPPGLTANV